MNVFSLDIRSMSSWAAKRWMRYSSGSLSALAVRRVELDGTRDGRGPEVRAATRPSKMLGWWKAAADIRLVSLTFKSSGFPISPPSSIDCSAATAATVSPLIRRVAFYGGPQTSDYLGIYQFGTEAFHTDGAANVTFTTKTLTMSIVKGIAPIDSAASTLVARNTGLLIATFSYVLWLLA